MVKKYFLISFLFLIAVFVSDDVYAQSKPQIVMEHITSNAVFVGSSTKPDSDVKLVNTIRAPTVADVADAMKKKKKVTVIISYSNGTAILAHALRVVAFNLTSYNGTNVDNETVIFNDAEIYDPATNATYNLTFSYIQNNSAVGYLEWYGWAVMRDVITIYKVKANPRTGGSSYLKKGYLEFLLFNQFKKWFLPVSIFR